MNVKVVVCTALCAGLFLSPASDAQGTDLHWVRIEASQAAALAALDLRGAQRLDYGAFVWLGVAEQQLPLLTESGLVAGPGADFTLDLGGLRFDPLQTEPSELFAPAWRAAETGAADDLHLIQLVGPTRADWLGSLRAAGFEPVQYIHPHTYVAWGPSTAAAQVRSAPFVRWNGAFEPAYRVLPRWRGLAAEPQQVDVMIYRGAGAAGVRQRLEQLGAQPLGYSEIDSRFGIATYRLPGDRFADAARIPGVYSIQVEPTDGGLRSEMSDQVNVGGYDLSNNVFPGYQSWLSSVGLSGAGIRMANVDGGVQESHPDLVGRMVSCSGTTCSGTSSSHGTHTAGIMAADGASGTTGSQGFLRGLGMAPGAELFEQVYSPFFTHPGGMLLLISDSHQNGAVLSSNSWGPAGSPRGYDNDTLQVDIGVRDADDTAAGNQSFTYVLSFMNGGGGTSTQGTPDEAKNLFNIGSTKMRTGSGAQDANINDLSGNSAHGPALDGRTIPHLVAPGCQVDSTEPNNSYGLKCGTSMASPHVSGAVGLFFEYYRGLSRGVGTPSPALVKAAFLPVAHDLAGFRDADGNILGHPFDSKQGWGRMDTAAVVDPQQQVAYFDNPLVLDNTGEEWSVTLSADDPTLPVRMMLVWTDAPGHGMGGATPAWNNNLDLIVEAGGDTYLGNQFGADGLSATGGVADDRNNTEGVFLAPTAPASITIRVVAANINSDGVPAVGDGTDQDFSLVCYNCISESSVLFADGFESGDTSAWSN